MQEPATKYFQRAFLGFCLLFIGGCIVLAAIALPGQQAESCSIRLPIPETGRTNYLDTYQPTKCIRLTRADTPKLRQKGLSGVERLPAEQGMLFIFDEPQDACIWMKDMKVSIDIIWLDDNRKVTKIKERVHPATYPEQFCYGETKYVIELAAGTANAAHLRVGHILPL